MILVVDSKVRSTFPVSTLNRYLKQRGRQKSNRFRLAKQQLCTWITLFFLYISLLSLHDYDVKMHFSRFVEDVNARQRLSYSAPNILPTFEELN